MRPSCVLLQLPLIPPRSTWKNLFDSKHFCVVNKTASKQFRARARRISVADSATADAFVDSFSIREGSHVLEAYGGLGFITRSLLKLPKAQVTSVVVVEPSGGLTVQSYGVPKDLVNIMPVHRSTWAKPDHEDLPQTSNKKFWTKETAADSQEPVDVKDLFATSVYYPPGFGHVEGKTKGRLSILDNTMYQWEVLVDLKDKGLLDDIQKKEWTDDPPNLHYIAQVPTSVAGEQIVHQWISCLGTQSWLWEYGRVPMSLMLSPSLYDRLVANPGDKAYCKLSVLKDTLVDIVPSHPNYYIQDYHGLSIPAWIKDKRMQGMADFKKVADSLEPIQVEPHARDILLETNSDNYYPLQPKKAATAKLRALERPVLMGVTLYPKKQPLMRVEEKEHWDFVLRRMFVTASQKLPMAIKNLGPGAENLIPALTDPSLPDEDRIDPTKVVREYTPADWYKIVKAFMKWPFAPDVLVPLDAQQEASVSMR